MSYAFGMYFKQMHYKEDMIDLVDKTSRLIWDNRETVINNARYSIPSLNNNKMPDCADNYWLHSLMTFKCVYWEKYGIFGVSAINCGFFSEEYPVSVIFQDSTDQDYDMDSWGFTIDLFNSIRDGIHMAGISEFAAMVNAYYSSMGMSSRTEKEILENAQYYERVLMYHNIYNALQLNDWLWDRENGEFKRFAVTPMDSSRKYTDCIAIMEKIREEEKEW